MSTHLCAPSIRDSLCDQACAKNMPAVNKLNVCVCVCGMHRVAVAEANLSSKFALVGCKLFNARAERNAALS